MLVDDYQLLSLASQVLAGLLAREGLVVTGDMQATSEVFEEYPYAAGLIEFAQADGVQTVQLDACWNSTAVQACCENLIGTAQTHEQESRDLAGTGENGEREARAFAGANNESAQTSVTSQAGYSAAAVVEASAHAAYAETAPVENPARNARAL